MRWYFIIAIIIGIIALLYSIVWFFIAPGSNKKVWDYSWLLKNPIAHRGYHVGDSRCPENSKYAFERAIKRNYNIEIDLNLTSDDKVVVFHDGNLKRMCGVDKQVCQLTLQEIKQLSLQNSAYRVMELQEFLSFVDGQVGLLIEFKAERDDIDKKLCEESMKILSNYRGKWVMQTFQPSILRWFKKNYPEVPRGQLSFDFLKSEKGKKKSEITHSFIARLMFTYGLSNFIGRPTFISRRYDNLNFACKHLHNYCPLLVWTVKSEDVYKLIYRQVDNVIFESLKLDENGRIQVKKSA